MSTHSSQQLTVPKTITPATVDRAEMAFKRQLSEATMLTSFEIFPFPRLKDIVYPCDKYNIPIPLSFDAWEEFTREHDILDDIHCFCSLRTGVSMPVKILRPRTPGDNFGSLCLGCKSWRRRPGGKTSGCRYFVNLTELFGGRLVDHCKQYPLKATMDFGNLSEGSPSASQGLPRLNTNIAGSSELSQSSMGTSESALDIFGPLNGHNNQHIDLFNGQDPFSGSYDSGQGREATGAKSSVGGPQAMSSSQGPTTDSPHTIGSQPWMSYICEGFVTDANRLSEAGDGSALLDFREVHDLPVPTLDATVAVLLRLFTENPGVKWGELMKVLGSCKLCGEVVALAAFSKHRCVRSFLDDISAAAATNLDAHSASSTPAVVSPASSEFGPVHASSSTLATPPLKLEEEHEGFLMSASSTSGEVQVKSEQNEEGGVEVIDLTHDDE